MEPGLSAVAFFAVPNLDPPDAEDRVASPGAHGFIVDICAVEIDRATGAVTVTDYASVHDAGTLLNPLLADGQVRGGFAHGPRRLFERHVYDGDGEPHDRLARRLRYTDRARSPGARGSTTSSRRRRSRRSARRGSARGRRCSRPSAIANAVADALGVDDVELPLTPARVW